MENKHKFKVGDKVVRTEYHLGSIFTPNVSYTVETVDENGQWISLEEVKGMGTFYAEYFEHAKKMNPVEVDHDLLLEACSQANDEQMRLIKEGVWEKDFRFYTTETFIKSMYEKLKDTCFLWRRKLEQKFPEIVPKDEMAIPVGAFDSSGSVGLQRFCEEAELYAGAMEILVSGDGEHRYRSIYLSKHYKWEIGEDSGYQILTIKRH